MRVLRVFLAAVGGAVGAVVVLGVIAVVNAGRGFLGATAATGLGWTLPLLTGLLAAGLAWSLTRAPQYRGGTRVATGAACPECGEMIRESWRLCPHCGARL